MNHLTAARAYRKLAELGLVAGRVGKGTFVRQAAPEATRALAESDDGSAWQLYALPDEVESHSDRIVGEMFLDVRRDDHIPLMTGYPSDDLFPTERFAQLVSDVVTSEGARVHQYGEVEGASELREELATLGHQQGWAGSGDEIVTTTGAAQAMSLVAQTLLRPGDIAAVESPTFPGSINSIRSTGASLMPVPVDADGLDVDALEQLVRRRQIKLLAMQPRLHNPTGRDLSPERRLRLLELARREGFFIVEDGVYADLRFEGGPAARASHGRPGTRHLHLLAVEDHVARPPRRLDRGPRPGPGADRRGQAQRRAEHAPPHRARPGQVPRPGRIRRTASAGDPVLP